MRLASFKITFARAHVRVTPREDERGCPFAGPSVELRGAAAEEALSLAAPVVAWFHAREPVGLRTLAFDMIARRVLVSLEPAPGQRPRVLRLGTENETSGALELFDLAAPLLARLDELARAQLAARAGADGRA